MNLRTVLAFLALLAEMAFISTPAGAAPWRYYHRGWYRPHACVRVVPPIPEVYIAPPAPVIVGGYYRPHYCGPRYYHPYRRPYCYYR